MSDNYKFTLAMRVFEPSALLAAARAHPDHDLSCSLLDEDGEVDVATCLVTILDPGHLPGCSIDSSEGVSPEGAEEGEYDFNLFVEVHTPLLLLEAARKHEDAGGDTFLDDDGEICVEDCLAMVLDPGSLEGCSIYSHHVEILSVPDLAHSEDDRPLPPPVEVPTAATRRPRM